MQEIPENLCRITYCLIYAIKFIATNKLQSVNHIDSSLSSSFIEIFAQMLNSIRNLLPWSPILQSESELKSLIESVAQILMPPLNILQEPRIITLSASQFILTVSTQVRPRYMLDCPSIKQLIQIGPSLTYLDRQAAVLIRNAIVNCCLLPWPNVAAAEQKFSERDALLREYVHSLSQDLMNLDHTAAHGQREKITKIIASVLAVHKEIVDYNRESNSTAKQMLAAAYRPIIAKSLELYGQLGCTDEDVANSVLNFALSVLQTLQIQLGPATVREMLDIFLEASMR